ncbi:ribonuclease E activity regulator RraA [Sinobaca sp. H24]|uniref:ribonuclease E activity regulator RraA n=1 Tax=Sinobaca sp. H24 TaxID=2923376 RepID=UPI0035B28830
MTKKGSDTMGFTADICDDYSDVVRVADPLFKRYGQKTHFSGPAATVRVFEDNVLVKKALQEIPEGSVLVVDGGGSSRCALMGDNLAEIAVERKLAGVIVYGCIRDSDEIADMDVGIFALGTNPIKSIKKGIGDANIPVVFASVKWQPGEWVYADNDGILLSADKLDL